ncbi:MAG: hypothetical protein UY72_C0076G0001 [Candidatus Uhrbacteria bacterium GW2011_GWD2_52_7]|uniref:Autoinducer 2 import system permease protein LsrD n=1 Tax=Candidatus Uhrbacteria bacterium GW2011_GWD2_52_7 TaxID=1618989 RepID=A0A0G1XBG1_9BACT|nr:MAG: hypothetical protein UY72_C0076G0001 [Candidatus Uhrbacteria bacterium GW2011_GWD2_52_7]
MAKRNLINILTQAYPIIIVSLGAAFVFSHGGMDLSYGGVLGVSILVTTIAAGMGVPVFLAILISIAVAVVCYLVNGFVSVYCNVSPFIACLCVLYICRGILNTVCAKSRISIPVDMFKYDNWTLKIPVLIVVVIISYLLFEKSKIGKASRAIGGNALAAQQAGINVKQIKMFGYMISAFAVGIASFFTMIRAGSVTTSTGQGLEMNIVTALVLGGIPLSGGSKVKILGAILGALTVILLRNGLIITGVNERIVEGIQGVALLLIVFLTYSKNKNALLN